MKLRCYCCGEPLGPRFVIAAMGEPKDTFDRAFVWRPECVARADGVVTLTVSPVPGTPPARTRT